MTRKPNHVVYLVQKQHRGIWFPLIVGTVYEQHEHAQAYVDLWNSPSSPRRVVKYIPAPAPTRRRR